jgi:hypothetical protein
MGKSISKNPEVERRRTVIRMKLICVGLIIILSSANSGMAQNSSLEFWPETDIWYKLNSSWRLSSFISITKYNESKERDLNIYVQGDYAWGKTKHTIYKRLVDQNKESKLKAWMVRSGFMEGWSLGKPAGEYKEDLLFAEIHKRIPLMEGILLSQRFRVDFRRVGTDPTYSYRFRYRIMIEKEYQAGRSSIVPYVNAELYWDSKYSSTSRVRLVGGATESRGKRFAYEANLTYQYDVHYNTANLYAINIILHVFFEKQNSGDHK